MNDSSAYKLILIEDDVDLREGWLDVFDMLGHHVRAYQNSLDLLADTDTIRTFDILITDYYLPDINGVELIKRVREMNPSLPVILLTGSRELSVVEAARNLPSCSILHKPLNIEDLDRRISEIFTNR